MRVTCGTELNIFRRNVYDPRALAQILERAEAYLAEIKHPDPVIRKSYDFAVVAQTQLGTSTDRTRRHEMVGFFGCTCSEFR